MLFTPGPVMTSEAVKAVLLQPDIPHRQPVFEQYVRRIRESLLRLSGANDGTTAVVVSGSGTAANETALSSIVRPGEAVLLLTNGEFGERLRGILEVYAYPLHVLDFGWAVPYDLEAIRKTLADQPAIGWVCMVYHETSTGMRNPVGAVGALTADAGRKLFVDCVSAIGGEPLDVVRDQIDVCTGVPNKAIAGLPGVSFVIARRSSVPELGEAMPRRNVYLNLQKHIEWSDRSEQTPNTPSVQMFVALDAALQELLAEGLERASALPRMRRDLACGPRTTRIAPAASAGASLQHGDDGLPAAGPASGRVHRRHGRAGLRALPGQGTVARAELLPDRQHGLDPAGRLPPAVAGAGIRRCVRSDGPAVRAARESHRMMRNLPEHKEGAPRLRDRDGSGRHDLD